MAQPEAPIFEEEYKTYYAHVPEWLAKGIGGFALIKGGEVHGPYETQNDAITVGYKTYGNVPFLVEPVDPALKDPVTIYQIAA